MQEGKMEVAGRRVFENGGYPHIYMPEHPTARVNGLVAVHRYVAYEAWGDEVLGKDVHHEDEDVWNWDLNNLRSEHATRHNPSSEPTSRTCGACGATLEIRKTKRAEKENVYCDIRCVARGRERIEWPDTQTVREMVSEMGFQGTGRVLGVSDNAVRKRLRNH